MASDKEITRISKLLSLVLRHQPEQIGIQLDEQGWTDVNHLLTQLNNAGHTITKEILQLVVETNSKKRFAFNDDQTLIRANQGHSIEVDLSYIPKEPPIILYHGTSEGAIPSILVEGLHKKFRHHVHLSAEMATAKTVGSRHGKPIVLVVAAHAMFKDGHIFFQSENGVWLTDHVPTAYIKPVEG